MKKYKEHVALILLGLIVASGYSFISETWKESKKKREQISETVELVKIIKKSDSIYKAKTEARLCMIEELLINQNNIYCTKKEFINTIEKISKVVTNNQLKIAKMEGYAEGLNYMTMATIKPLDTLLPANNVNLITLNE